MASSFLFLSFTVTLFYVTQADLVSDVCSKSTNPSLCNEVLGSSHGSDLRSLGQIILPKAIAAAQNVISAAKSVRNGSNANKVDTCMETSGDAIDNLKECASYLKESSRRAVSDLQTKGSAALTDVSTCDDEFGNGEPPKLKAASRTTQDLIDILLVIANKL